MSDALQDRVEECFVQAEQFFNRPFKRATVSTNLRGQRAGVAHLTTLQLRFNAWMYQQNEAHFLTHVVAHEVAHLIAHQLFGSRIRPHGAEWKSIMLKVYQLPADRCHHYAVPTKNKQVYHYHCQCPSGHDLSAQRHARVQKQRSNYRCLRCKTLLMFSGSQRWVSQ